MMNYKDDLKTILSAFYKVGFNGRGDLELSEDNCCILEEIIDVLQEELNFICDYATGCTKFVVIPEEKDKDYVVKVPFNGQWIEGYNSYSSYNDDTYSSNYDRDGVGFWEFEGAAFEGSMSDWDYCEREAWIYNLAIGSHIEDMFAGTFWAADVKSYPVYVSERAAEIYRSEAWKYIYPDGEIYREFLEEFVERTYKGSYYEIPSIDFTFAGYMLYYYGEEKFKAFIKFANDYNINDLHSGNIGFIGDRPVLIDYSGFWH